MKALVTGAAGFVGRHLVDHLSAEGDEVITTDRSNGGPDLLDSDDLIGLLAEHRPEIVYHLAGQADVGGSWSDPSGTFRTNAMGTLNLLSAARTCDVRRTLIVSSADVYGHVSEAELPITEAFPLRPSSPYGASKAAADLIGLQAHLGFGQDVIRIRAFNHLGPGQDDRFVCAALAARIVENHRSGRQDLPVGNLSARRDFTDVRDVVRAYRLLAVMGAAGAAYNVCTGRSVLIEEIAHRLIEISGHAMGLVPDSNLLRPVDLHDLRGDPTAVRTTTGWSPRIDLDQTLSDLLEDRRRRLATSLPAD